MLRALKSYLIPNLNKYISWDIYNWSRAFNFIDSQKSRNFFGKRVLEIGANNGELSFWAADKGANVICSDINGPSIDAIKMADNYHINNIRFLTLDALNLSYKNTFDYVLFKSVLGGVGRGNHYRNQSLMFSKIHDALKPKGECLFIENMKGAFMHQLLREKYGAAKNKWIYPSLNDFYQFSKQFHKVKYKTFGVIGCGDFPLKLFRSKIDVGLENIIPKQWNYIYAGVYQK